MEELIKAVQELGKPGCLDYIQLVATVISVIISALAVYYAVKVPKKIADEQNKIALFEKRNSVYVGLSEMFFNRPIFSTAVFNSIDERKNKKPVFDNYNSLNKEKSDRALLIEATFLFSDVVSKKINALLELRAEFFKLEKIIEEGITYFSTPDLELLLEEYVDGYILELADCDKIKEIAAKNAFTKSGEPLDENGEPIIYNVFDLIIEQDKIHLKIKKLQDQIIEDIVDEMHL